MDSLWLLLPLLGLTVGLLAGLFGIGGGLILVPALTLLLPALALATPEQALPMAIATALASAVMTGSASALTHWRSGKTNLTAVRRLAPGLAVGAVMGAWLVSWMPVSWMGVIFGAFELLIALNMFLGGKPRGERPLPGLTGSSLFALPAGGFSAMLGIGGGTLTVPWLLWHQVPMASAVATASLLGVVIALSGSSHFLLSGSIAWPALLAIMVTSLLSAPLGARLSHRLPVATLKRGFALLLALLGTHMLWRHL